MDVRNTSTTTTTIDFSLTSNNLIHNHSHNSSQPAKHRHTKSSPASPISQFHEINHNFYNKHHSQPAFWLEQDSKYDSYSYRGVSIRSSHYSFDDLWALEEEEQDRSAIYNSQLDTTLFSNPLLANSLNSHPSPLTEPHDGQTSDPPSSPRSRSLTDPAPVFDSHDEMTTFAQRSDSPPELTSSKSSKSSSFQSSTFSGFDATTTSDLAHFEDIGLDDDHSHVGSDSLGSRLNHKPSTRNLAGPLGAGKNHSPAISPMRELVNGASRTSLNLTSGSKIDNRSSSVSSLGLPSGSRRVVSQTLNQASIRNRSRSRSRSRSASPAHQMQGPVTPSSIPAHSPALRSTNSFGGRRPSSGPTGAVPKPRKTAKEIENEYNDSDEDLPDDASLWNVPMSPNMYRAASAANSANVSASTSPERPSYSSTPRPSKATPITTPKTAPVISAEFPRRFPSQPPSPNARLSRGNTTGTMPDTYAFGKGRTKSWNNALSDLSEEAKALSEALDAHAVEKSSKNEVAVQEESIPEPMPNRPLRAKSSMIELPPLRTNNIMIDPLPISKEKEKVLSRTRPSWLPPKNPKEEKKHLKEYQRMMELSLEAEKRRAAKEVSAKCARDDTAATLERLWNDHVLPHWDKSIREPRTRELWWRGIPSTLRPIVWQRAITNELGLTSTTYEKALTRAKTFESSVTVPSAHSNDVPKEFEWLFAIRRDVESTFPALQLFQRSQPLHQQLIDILSAFAFYRADVGYAHGSHLPAAMLLYTLRDPATAFTALANLLNRPLPLAFLTGDPAGTQRAYELVMRLMSSKRPQLYQHLFGKTADGGLGMAPEEILEPLLRTLFLSGCCEQRQFTEDTSSKPTSRRNSGQPRVAGLSLPLALRTWDILVFDGDTAILRTCMGLIAARESALYGTREEVLSILGWGGELGLDAETDEEVEAVIAVVRDVGKEDAKARGRKQ